MSNSFGITPIPGSPGHFVWTRKLKSPRRVVITGYAPLDVAERTRDRPYTPGDTLAGFTNPEDKEEALAAVREFLRQESGATEIIMQAQMQAKDAAVFYAESRRALESIAVKVGIIGPEQYSVDGLASGVRHGIETILAKVAVKPEVDPEKRSMLVHHMEQIENLGKFIGHPGATAAHTVSEAVSLIEQLRKRDVLCQEVLGIIGRISGTPWNQGGKEWFQTWAEDNERRRNEPPRTFVQELASLINRYSLERLGGDTPDFMIAEFLYGQLVSLGALVDQRAQWYGRGDSPCGGSYDIPKDTVGVPLCVPGIESSNEPLKTETGVSCDPAETGPPVFTQELFTQEQALHTPKVDIVLPPAVPGSHFTIILKTNAEITIQ